MASSIPRLVDWHVHTKFSSCCKGGYGIAEVWETAEKQQLAGVGVTDHSNYTRHNVSFLRTQRKEIVTFGLQNHMRLGLEITILNRKGKLGVNSKVLKQLDFYLISEHLHIAKPFTEFYKAKEKVKAWLVAGDQAKIHDLARRTQELMVAGMRDNPGHVILAHPWRFFLGRDIIDNLLLDLTPALCEIAQEKQVSLEMPRSHLQHWQNRDKNPLLFEFIRSFWRIASRYDLRVSLGSDAHALENLGQFTNLIEAFNDFGLSPNRLLTLEDVPFTQNPILK